MNEGILDLFGHAGTRWITFRLQLPTLDCIQLPDACNSLAQRLAVSKIVV